MTIASRTPEGEPARCPVCGHAAAVEPSEFPTRDAPCPACGCLLWFAAPVGGANPPFGRRAGAELQPEGPGPAGRSRGRRRRRGRGAAA
jgi:hypothetical protein